MPGVLERTLSHLSATLEQAEQAHRSATSVSLTTSFDPRAKVISALLITIAAVSSKQLYAVVGLMILLAALALMAKIAWKRLLAAWASGIFFAALVAVPAIYTSGWKIALTLVLRSEISLTCWLMVIMTTPFNFVLRALRALYVPVVLVAILSMTFRYIFLLVETAQDMLLSRRSRIVGKMNGAENRRLLVSTTGVLLGKTIQMSDDVYHAMISRGFRGEVYVLEEFKMQGKDWLLLGVSVLLLVLVR